MWIAGWSPTTGPKIIRRRKPVTGRSGSRWEYWVSPCFRRQPKWDTSWKLYNSGKLCSLCTNICLLTLVSAHHGWVCACVREWESSWTDFLTIRRMALPTRKFILPRNPHHNPSQEGQWRWTEMGELCCPHKVPYLQFPVAVTSACGSLSSSFSLSCPHHKTVGAFSVTVLVAKNAGK